MKISGRSKWGTWASFSACFLLVLFCGVGNAASIAPADLHGERVIFGGISGDYTVNYYDDTGLQQDVPYTYAGPVIWQAALTNIGSDDMAASATTITLLSEYLVGGDQKYQSASISSQWYGSDLQKWLDSSALGDFLEYFNPAEQGAVKSQTMPESTETNGGILLAPPRTAGPSKAFILNGRTGQYPEDELNDFIEKFKNIASINDDDRICFDIQYQYPNIYWTRSCGGDVNGAAYVTQSGDLFSGGHGVNHGDVAVRPALKLDLQSVIFQSLIGGSELRDLFGFDLKNAAADGEDLITEAKVLFFATKETDPSTMTANGDTITIEFASGQNVVHAYTGTPTEAGLARRFTVTKNASSTAVPVALASVSNDIVTLKLKEAIGTNDTNIRVSYVHTDGCTDGIGFTNDRKALDTFATTQTATNETKIDFDPNTPHITGTARSTITPVLVTATAISPATISSVTPSATMPAWLSVEAVGTDTIMLSGTPTAASSGSFEIAATDSNNATSSLLVTYDVSPADNPGPGPSPTPSSNTTPSSVSITVDGTKYDGERQSGSTYLITVPYGTDISNLTVSGTLPAGATSVPKLPVSHDFTQGPLEITITAQDGKTTATYTINVQVEKPDGPTERAFFTINVADCEIVITQNADGTLAVKVRIPFASDSNPALLDTARMIASLFNLTDVSYSYVDTQGNDIPLQTLQASKGNARAPYLQIAGMAADMEAIKDGAITSIQYTLKNDATQYAQTFSGGGLKIASMPGYPSPEPAPDGSSSSGCDAGMAGLAVVVLMGAMVDRRKKD